MIDVPDPILGTVKLVGPVAKLSGSPEPVTRPAPLLGEHTAEVLREFGIDDAGIERLRRDGVV
jgi:formyl-CoA transferase